MIPDNIPRFAGAGRFSNVKLLKFVAIALLSSLPSCREQAVMISTPEGMALADLVTADESPVFATEPPYTEVVDSGGVWQVHDDGKLLGAGRPGGELSERLKEAMQRVRNRNGEERLLLAAGGTTPFSEVRSVIREAAKAGFWRLEFLVRSSAETGIRSLRVDLPTMDGRGNPWPGEPNMIQIRSDGSIHVGTGPNRISLESSSGTEHLDAYCSSIQQNAIKSKSSPPVQIYADFEAPFQRVIDVLSGLHTHGISNVYFIDPDESHREHDERSKPLSPGESR